MKRRWFGVVFMLVCAATLMAGGAQEDPAKEMAPFQERYMDMSWDEIVAEAEGQTIYVYMWGGNDMANQHVVEFLGGNLKEKYGITVEQVPVNGAQVFMNKILGEKDAGKDTDGSVDLMWINQANFHKMKDAECLFGPFTTKLPNIQYINWEDPSVSWDGGAPTEDFESPWGTTQVVMIYDTARIKNPPKSIGALLDWVKANPGKYTYPTIDDFTGQDFVKHVFYDLVGGADKIGVFDQAVWDEYSPQLWDKLNELEPYLWREGKTYPESLAKLDTLFANGEIDFILTYGPSNPAKKIDAGTFPETVMTYVFDEGTIGGFNYFAISYNSSSKAAAMVYANEAISIEAQYDKALPEKWGSLPAFEMSRLPADWQTKFENLERAPSVLSPAVLSAHMLPEIHQGYLRAIIEGWKENVLAK